jgi:heat shock protein HslJ
VSEQTREPHLVLSSASARVTGSTGCNRLAGNYVLDGDALSFSRSAGTMRACLEGMAQERDFLDVLVATRKWRIDAGHLELLDAQDALLARFQAVWLR